MNGWWQREFVDTLKKRAGDEFLARFLFLFFICEAVFTYLLISRLVFLSFHLLHPSHLFSKVY
jgi:hypothetical protein